MSRYLISDIIINGQWCYKVVNTVTGAVDTLTQSQLVELIKANN